MNSVDVLMKNNSNRIMRRKGNQVSHVMTHTGTTMLCSQRSTERLQCIRNNVATERAVVYCERVTTIVSMRTDTPRLLEAPLHTESSALSHRPLISAAAQAGDRPTLN